MDLFTELYQKEEQQAKAAELHAIKRMMQWVKARVNRSIKTYPADHWGNDKPWFSLNTMQSWGHDPILTERAMNELCYQGFFEYKEAFNWFCDGRYYRHTKVYFLQLKTKN